MNEIKCPCDLNQFLLGEPRFENPFPEEECELRKFIGDCYHCFSVAIAIRDHQLKWFFNEDVKPKTGHWISFGVQGEVDGQIVQTFTCSECGAISIFRLASGNIVNGDLCPNCGCRMVEPQERSDKE